MDFDSLTTNGTLTKLKITSLEDLTKSIEVMFNPESYSRTYSISYEKKSTVDTKGEAYVYTKSDPQDFNLTFYIDGTGVSNYHATMLPVFKKDNKSVKKKVAQFIDLTYYPTPDNKIPVVKIEWGTLKIDKCRLKDVKVTYMLFSRDGDPLRAKLEATFVIDAEEISSAGGDAQPEVSKPNPGDSGENVTNGIVISVS